MIDDEIAVIDWNFFRISVAWHFKPEKSTGFLLHHDYVPPLEKDTLQGWVNFYTEPFKEQSTLCLVKDAPHATDLFVEDCGQDNDNGETLLLDWFWKAY